jgi:predicted TPR repeat methyltransferase
MDNEQAAEALSSVLSEVIRFTSTLERLAAAGEALRAPVTLLQRIVENDPDLSPEIAAALGQLVEVAETIRRASTFVEARLDARLENIADSLGLPEGE